MKLYPYRKCYFLQVHRQRKNQLSGLHNYYTNEGTIILITRVMLLLCLHTSAYNTCYASFMITQDSSEEFNRNNNDMSGVTGVTCTTETTFYTEHTRFNLLE